MSEISVSWNHLIFFSYKYLLILTAYLKESSDLQQFLFWRSSTANESLLGIDFEEVIPVEKTDITGVILIWMIKEIQLAKYNPPHGNYEANEKILQLLLKDRNTSATCHLREDWLHMTIEQGDLAYVSGIFTMKNSILSILVGKKSSPCFHPPGKWSFVRENVLVKTTFPYQISCILYIN